MNNEHTIDLEEVIRGEDGVYRWMYQMNMEENKSMLYMLLKIFAWISVGCLAMWFIMMAIEGSMGIRISTVLLIWLLATAATELLVYLGYEISRKVMKGTYVLRFEMDDRKISIYQSAKNMERRKAQTYGRKPFQDTVSEASFNSVLSVNVHRNWDMIDMAVIGGRFQVYVWDEDFDLVLDHILSHVPERVRKSYK